MLVVLFWVPLSVTLGSGYTDGTFTNAGVVSLNGRGNSLFIDEVVYSGGVLTGFTLKVNEANTGIGYVEEKSSNILLPQELLLNSLSPK